MKKLILISLVLISAETFLPVIPILKSQETMFKWIESSTGDQNDIVVESFRMMDLDERITAIDLLAGRTDRDFGFLIEELYYSKNYKTTEKEYLLYLILEKLVTDAGTADDTGEYFLLLCGDIAVYRQSILRKKIIERTTLMKTPDAEKILLKEAVFLEKTGLRDSYFNSEMIEEYRIFTREAEKTGSIILKDYIHRIYTAVRNL
ncbi:MAG: hypothetical protein H7A26_02375 [Spirochaetales bacterium]|nr:hypothetical protein [Spirochaetales bacterium]